MYTFVFYCGARVSVLVGHIYNHTLWSLTIYRCITRTVSPIHHCCRNHCFLNLRLLEGILHFGTLVVFTSNRPPKDLYKVSEIRLHMPACMHTLGHVTLLYNMLGLGLEA